MDNTITGAVSGETVMELRRRRVHNLRQKDRWKTEVFLLFCRIGEIGYYQSLFLCLFI